MQRRFVTLDVFTGRRFTGNPLAVVLDADGLDTAAMQTIAREFNHPETVFTFAPEHAANRARLRIFTPVRELPFAGHPTVGTAVLLGLQNGSGAGHEIVLEESIGLVRCTLVSNDHDRGRARFAIPQLPAELGVAIDEANIAAALHLSPADIGFDQFRPSRWSAGIPFTFVPVAGLDAVRQCQPNPARFDTAFGEGGAVYIFCSETAEPGHHFHARMFAHAMGIPEDPATGSAAAAFAGALIKFARPGDGNHAVTIEQGYEMGRPSLVELVIVVEGGKLKSASIGGDAVIVTTGTIEA